MRFPFQELKTTNARYNRELKEAASRVIDSGWYVNGPETKAFERELSAYLGVNGSVSTGSGLDAIRMIFRGYMELGRLKEGDEVIVAANTFIATMLPLTEMGLKVVLAEPSEETFGLDLTRMEGMLTDKTRAVAVTHLYGTPSWDFAAAERLRAKGIILVEDNAQAIGASISGRRTGSLGDASALSFYPAKNIGALGDSGAVSSSDDELLEVVRALHDYGGHRRYYYDYRGYNSRMDELQAAMLRIKLRDADAENERRLRAAETYDRHITNPQIFKPRVLSDRRQVWHQYVIRSARRDALADYLATQGVGTGIHYPVAPHQQECYRGEWTDMLPVTERLAAEVLSLPIANISEGDAREIAEIINNAKAL